jgi:hypothetical protein
VDVESRRVGPFSAEAGRFRVEVSAEAKNRLATLEHGATAAKPDASGHRPADYVKDRNGDPVASEEIAEMPK